MEVAVIGDHFILHLEAVHLGIQPVEENQQFPTVHYILVELEFFLLGKSHRRLYDHQHFTLPGDIGLRLQVEREKTIIGLEGVLYKVICVKRHRLSVTGSIAHYRLGFLNGFGYRVGQRIFEHGFSAVQLLVADHG